MFTHFNVCVVRWSCAVHWGMFSTPRDITEYTGGCSVHRGNTLSTLGSVQYTGGYHDECVNLLSTPGDVQCTGVSIQIQLFSH